MRVVAGRSVQAYHSANFFVYGSMMSSLRALLLVCSLLVPGLAPAAESDPLESINRPIFVFNDHLDRYLLKPVAEGYRFVLPDPAERGVSNFFDNLQDFNGTLNALLQWRLPEAARNGGRFLLNTSFGVLGLFDVATPMGVDRYRTDFGHTLARWGAPEGAYLVVPLFGPRTVRSGLGNIVDTYGSLETQVDDVRTRNTLYALDIVDSRVRLLKAEELITGDRYIFIRDAYLQQRRALVTEGVVEDSFSDFENGWEDDL
jgi:phospholipid-binding lipoprotein MlaA